MITLTKKEAKTYLTRYHQINTSDRLYGEEGVLSVMEKLHFIQYDPLDVVGKNTDLTLQARINNYHKGDINKALYQSRSIIDGWDKMMGVILAKDYPYLEEVRKWRASLEVNTLKKRLQIDALKYEDVILDIIKEEPKFAKDINHGQKVKQLWGHTKTSTATLDYLFHKGIIGVRSRNNTQKEYDLMENLIKEHYQPSTLSIEAFKEYYLLRRIETLGIMRNKKGVHLAGPYIYDNKTRNDILNQLFDKDLIVPLKIEGVKETCYISKRYQNLENNIVSKISFLAPLDNMLYDRDLIELVFDFKYRWEVYTPKAKREYGYYVLPILYKTDLIGRIEFDKHRNNEPLIIKNIWLDKENKTILKELEKAITRFSSYLGAKGALYENNDHHSR